MSTELAELRKRAEAGQNCIDNDGYAAVMVSPKQMLELLDEIERLRGLVEVAKKVEQRQLAALDRWEEFGRRHDIDLRVPGCTCDREVGDSACPVHGDEA